MLTWAGDKSDIWLLASHEENVGSSLIASWVASTLSVHRSPTLNVADAGQATGLLDRQSRISMRSLCIPTKFLEYIRVAPKLGIGIEGLAKVVRKMV